jgi:hypothetical protein
VYREDSEESVESDVMIQLVWYLIKRGMVGGGLPSNRSR